jgi:hypothetical protein
MREGETGLAYAAGSVFAAESVMHPGQSFFPYFPCDPPAMPLYFTIGWLVEFKSRVCSRLSFAQHRPPFPGRNPASFSWIRKVNADLALSL